MEAIAVRLEAIASRFKAIAIRLEAIANMMEAIASRLEAIPSRLEAIAISILPTSSPRAAHFIEEGHFVEVLAIQLTWKVKMSPWVCGSQKLL